jgi:uncharacterized membrane protein YkvA (DUF1232 family)
MPWWAWLLVAVVSVMLGLSLAALALLRSARHNGNRAALARRVTALPWRAKLSLFWQLTKDGRVPWWAKTILPGLALYLAMPIDLIPDFIPVLGHLDDLLMALVAVALLLRAVPTQVTEEHLTLLERGSEQN